MARTRVSRKSLKEPDEFISFSSRLIQQAVVYKTKLLLGAGVLFAVLVVVSATGYFLNRSENQGSLLLSRLVERYDKALNDEGSEKAYEMLQEEFQAFITDYSGRRCGKFARLAFANYSYRAGKYDEAAAQYVQVMKAFEAVPMVKTMAALSLGYTYEEKKEYEKAVQLFETIAADPHALMADEALFALGRLYGVLGKKDMRAQALSQLADKHPNSMYKELALAVPAG